MQQSPAYVAGDGVFFMMVYERCRRFVWLVLALLLALFMLPRAAHAVPVDSLTLGVAPVVDAAQALEPGERAALDARLRAIHEKGLMQAAVVLVDSTDGEPIFDYGMKIAEKWKLGKAGKDDGLLILIAVQDRKYQTLTGQGLEGVLTDVSLTRIQRDAFPPNFKSGNYVAGINAALGEMERRLTADADTLKELLADDKKEIEGDWLDKALAWGIVGGLLLLGVGVWFLIIWAIESSYSITRWITAPVAGLLTGVCAWFMDTPPLHAAIGGVVSMLLYIPFAHLLTRLDALPSPSGSGSGSSSSHDSGYSRDSGYSSSSSSSSGYGGGGGRFGGGGAGGGW